VSALLTWLLVCWGSTRGLADAEIRIAAELDRRARRAAHPARRH
jgi:hypothetical protein